LVAAIQHHFAKHRGHRIDHAIHAAPQKPISVLLQNNVSDPNPLITATFR
jgi:hypothetical protein